MPSSQSKSSKYVWLYIALIVAMMAVVKVSTVETAMKAEHRLVTSALGQTSSDYVYSHSCGLGNAPDARKYVHTDR